MSAETKPKFGVVTGPHERVGMHGRVFKFARVGEVADLGQDLAVAERLRETFRDRGWRPRPVAALL